MIALRRNRRDSLRKYGISCAMALGAAGALAMALTVPSQPAMAIPVFDVANYAQNLLTAARTLQQVNQQIQSLQNEASMLTNMAKNLTRIDFPELDALKQTLGQVNQLINQAKGIGFRIDQLDNQFRALFPDDFDALIKTDQRVTQARVRLDTAKAAFQHSMEIQSQIVGNVADDTQAMSGIIAKSQGAEGSLQAQQATNQLLALATKQQFQIQTLMAAQYRSNAVEQARRVQAEADAHAATRQFLGTGSAYTAR
jgi:P-type conjugative transfer protein TrbJ